jgi:hypothetical protein
LGLIVFAEQLKLHLHGHLARARTDPLISRMTTFFAITNLAVSVALLPFFKVQDFSWRGSRRASPRRRSW